MAQISIVVPVYNAEKYLEECIMSVIGQTFSDWTLILVNDGSKDRSEEICISFAQKDSRIRLITQNNQGSFAALRTGIYAADTPYIMFLDNDDVYLPEMLETMYSAITRENADCVQCGYVKFKSDGSESIPLPFQNDIMNRQEISKRILKPFFTRDADIYRHWSAARWNKIYRTELLQEVYDTASSDNVIGEDLEMALRYVNASEKIITLGNTNLYRYRVLNQSLARGYSEKMYQRYHDLTGIMEKTAFDLGYPFTAKRVFEDRGVLNMLTELSHTENLDHKEKNRIRRKLISELHDKKLLYKQLLNLEFPGKELLQKVYRKIRN
ncbi:MAG: glycosyltransferase [Solobacterium sp.]|nr:glycosyltransferase [Solobacterium sp.]